MKRLKAFLKRNLLEMLRDPIIYIFCLGFPVVMLVLFQAINHFTDGNTPVFEAKSLLPGIIMFSFSFVMLLTCILVSKDKTSALLIRLYTSPMRTAEYIAGYALPCLVVGIAQEAVCVFVGWIITLLTGAGYFGFGSALLLMIAMLPVLIIFTFLGILFGSVLNDKSAPGISSVIISSAGILGGAWMPLDAMGGFETFCRVLPFYPSVYIGRVVTGATHTVPDSGGVFARYAFDSVAALGLIPIAVVLAVSIVLSLLAFRKNMNGDKR